jgi:hypothetical protein
VSTSVNDGDAPDQTRRESVLYERMFVDRSFAQRAFDDHTFDTEATTDDN